MGIVIAHAKSALAVIGVLLMITIRESIQDPKELSLGDHKLCSDITKRKVKYESLHVTQGRASQHAIPWYTPDICKFEVQSYYPKGGVVAVIQSLELRINLTTNECIDYIQFRTKKDVYSQRHCGLIEARINMNYDKDDAPPNVLPEFYPISYGNSFIDVDGEMDVIIYIAKQPLEFYERTQFSVVFTSYQDCSSHHQVKHVTLRECDENFNLKICINRDYFGDGFINCPHFKCLDEGGCLIPMKPELKSSIGHKVVIGSITTLATLFAIFILIIWGFRKHKLLCWAEEFANPTATNENNRNSRVIEMHEQTGARLANTPIEPGGGDVPPSAPLSDQDKDLPPSYESLFPDTVNQR